MFESILLNSPILSVVTVQQATAGHGDPVAPVVLFLAAILIGVAYTVIMWPEISRRTRQALLDWRAALATLGVATVMIWMVTLGIVPILLWIRRLALAGAPGPKQPAERRELIRRVSMIVFLTTAVSSIVFQSTTFALPKVFDERLKELVQTSFGIGVLVAAVYSIAAFVQVLVGVLIDKVEMRRLMVVIASAQVATMFIAASLEGWALLFAAFFMMLAVFGHIPLNDAIVGKYCADEYRSRVYAVRYVVTVVVKPDAFADVLRAQRLPEGWVVNLLDGAQHAVNVVDL